jgi:hypothetical protein
MQKIFEGNIIVKYTLKYKRAHGIMHRRKEGCRRRGANPA